MIMESEISGGDLCEHTAIVRAYRTELESYLSGRGTSIESIQEHAASALRSGIPVAQLAAIHHLAVTTALDRSDGTQALSTLTRIACAACPIWDSAQSCDDCTGGTDR